MQVERYSSYFIVNSLVPIILTTALGFFVFLLDGDDMEKRLGESVRDLGAWIVAHALCCTTHQG